jgi:adenylate cyclase
MTLIPIEWSIARAQVRATTKLLSRYVAKPVLRDLLRRQDFNPLKPRAANITVLVADMADYSKITANQSLEATASITRRFLECITAPVWELQGTLDRYTGDGLVAFWGAPVHVVDQADRAIDAAKLMLARIDTLNQQFREEGLPEVAARIGIASGHALVGDFGTQFRATYTAVGNCINTASRLEATAKDLHLQVVIAESVAEESHRHMLEPLGEQDVRGIGRMKIFTTARPVPPEL